MSGDLFHVRDASRTVLRTMQVSVGSTGEVIASDLRLARNVIARTRGLMLAPKLAPGTGLDIRPCSSIHMMFMRGRIDAVFYNRDFRVTKVVHRLPTWYGLAFGGKGAWAVIELPPGAAAGVHAGDELVFNEEAGS